MDISISTADVGYSILACFITAVVGILFLGIGVLLVSTKSKSMKALGVLCLAVTSSLYLLIVYLLLWKPVFWSAPSESILGPHEGMSYVKVPLADMVLCTAVLSLSILVFIGARYLGRRLRA